MKYHVYIFEKENKDLVPQHLRDKMQTPNMSYKFLRGLSVVSFTYPSQPQTLSDSASTRIHSPNTHKHV